MRKTLLFILLIILFSGSIFLVFRFLDRKEKGNNMNESQVSSSAILGSQKEASAAAFQKVRYVRIETSKGSFTIQLFPEETPKTVANFLKKANSGYYQNLIFHRVENWVAQGGDPMGNGTGGGNIATELSQRPFEEGSVGVARGGNINISNDSQFFVCTQDCSWLTGQYTNFGEVSEGMGIVKSLAVGDKILKIEPLSQ
ncbi:peptidylprolyl isomerase [candidate division WWE3 bacterium CG06_land_8_20_14_3_00_42_16]|uniref:Peptidyl-prolyl cis-trans isomerase n=3 Tax=Katanobacteria TaxID=422282 RepID=A0A2M7AP07_UNCKA|nr:MAG: peptidylprolyl isomerase [candidate division WWE3 bacterium CG06_land_8_20_14_3_00_42_16]PJA37434.1 MAG: peptidylprolyl isomerase [candidate division WWE3 bacterium CG_4_9_14_3_um_filter_43_9]PJC69160.1 MAG: peptidylprolyl isomerase [candidate division WWE3 bacterium CG_4_8_14_3_um_filter_42_11]